MKMKIGKKCEKYESRTKELEIQKGSLTRNLYLFFSRKIDLLKQVVERDHDVSLILEFRFCYDYVAMRVFDTIDYYCRLALLNFRYLYSLNSIKWSDSIAINIKWIVSPEQAMINEYKLLVSNEWFRDT